MGDFSMELCGGTHVNRTGDIGCFKIVSEGGVAAGVRRIEAVTAAHAQEWVDSSEAMLGEISSMVKASGRDDVVAKVGLALDRARLLEKELEKLKAKLASAAGSDLASQAVDVSGIKVLAAKLEGVDPKSLRETVDQLKNKLGTAAIVLSCVDGDKVSLAAGVTKDAIDRIKAGDLVNVVAQQVGGRGGGRPDMAMAGGNDPSKLDEALSLVKDWVQQQIL
jgi:alanyl-tRNA synthetase